MVMILLLQEILVDSLLTLSHTKDVWQFNPTPNFDLFGDAFYLEFNNDIPNIKKFNNNYGDVGVKFCNNTEITITKNLKKPLCFIYKNNNLNIKLNIKNNLIIDLIEYFIKNEDYFTATIKIDINIENNSLLNNYRINESLKNNNYIYNNISNMGENSHKNTFDINLASSIINADLSDNLNHTNANTCYYAIDLLGQECQSIRVLNIFHNAPSTHSNQIFRGVYTKKSLGNFLGKIIIDKSAQKSSALQHYKAIITNKNAKALVKPQMQINNNDITAKHGASIGELNQDALFYLQSRGINYNQAKQILIYSLLQDSLTHIPNKNILILCQDLINTSLNNLIIGDINNV